MSDSASTSQSGPSTEKRSLNHQRVLDEDEYTEALSHIIARDFFPSLVHLDATNGYLDALSSQDPQLINASVRRLEEVSNTPLMGFGETPLRTPVGRGEPARKRAKYDTTLSLDNFQARYTSEDNASFTEILDDENQRRKEKYRWAWDAQHRVTEQRTRALEDREKLLICGPEDDQVGVRQKLQIEQPKPVGLITNGSEDDSEPNDGTTALTVTEGGEDEEVDVMAPKKDKRKAGVEGWEFKTRNALMFAPDADDSPYRRRANTINTDPKEIKHNNTRLEEQDEGTSDARTSSGFPSPTRSRINAAINDVPYRPKSPPNSFSLVPAVPSPTPSQLGPDAVKQLMTWGSLSATPRIISKGDDEPMKPPSTPFRIAEPTSREALSHKLAGDARKSLRVKAGLLSGATPRGRLNRDMAPPSMTPRKTSASLTPAARNLLDRSTMGSSGVRRAQVMEKERSWSRQDSRQNQDLNKVRWTPTPGR